jgi:anti-anti-sigma factor
VIQAAPLYVRMELLSQRATVHVAGELDIASLGRVERVVEEALAAGAGRIEIDLRDLTFMDSSGLRLIISLHHGAEREGWTLSLVKPLGPPLEVFELTRAAEHLPFRDSPSRMITRPPDSPEVLAEMSVALARNVEAPGAARAALTSLCEEQEVDRGIRQTLVLLASEVVSNAVLHSNGPAEAPIALSAAVEPEAIRVTVTDAGEGFVPSERDPERLEGGYGLYLLEKAASSWGVEADGATVVWFELPLQRA